MPHGFFFHLSTQVNASSELLYVKSELIKMTHAEQRKIRVPDRNRTHDLTEHRAGLSTELRELMESKVIFN